MSRQSQRSQSQSGNKSIQPTLEESFHEINQNLDEHVADLVRYIVNRAGEHSIFKRTDIKKNVLPKVRSNFQTIVDRTTQILENVYGYKMMSIDSAQPSGKSYIVTNNLPHISDPVQQKEDSDNPYPEDVHRILLLLILSHIFMSNNTVSEVSMSLFLQTFKIDVERKHAIFGDVKEYIFNTLKAKKYLEIETDQVSKKVTFKWGPRSEIEISKHDILNFVCKMYKDRMPSSWTNHFNIANEQNLKNRKELPAS